MNRRAFSILEVTIALVLLTATTGAVGRFAYEVQRGLRDRELASSFSRELENVSERIRSWNPNTITAARIEAIPLSESITDRINDARLRANVTPISSPIVGVEITLALECRLFEQSATPEKLTVWIAVQEGETDAS